MSVRDQLLAVPNYLLRSGEISIASLVFMDFLHSPRRFWAGWGDLEAGGHAWQGTGEFISLSVLSDAYDIAAEQVTFELAATQEMVTLSRQNRLRVLDRPVVVYGQMFATDGRMTVPDGAGGTVEADRGQPLGPPFAVFTGQMKKLRYSGEGLSSRTISLECEGLFVGRNAPPRGRWSPQDQRARHPGDRGLDRTSLYAAGYTVKWPG